MKRRQSRKRGSIATLAFIGLIPLTAAIGGVAVDSMHFNDARGALQRATDAAALAGAQDLNNYVGNKSLTATSQGSGNEEPVNFALSLASMNAVDGALGVYSSGNRSISATIRYDAALGGGVPTRPNRCDVTGTIYIRSLLAHFFGNYGQSVTTHSSAGLTGVNSLEGFSPMLVSWYDPDPDGSVLEKTLAGQTYTVLIKEMGAKKGEKDSNAVWIDRQPKDLQALIDYLAGLGARPSTSDIPAYKIGDTVKTSNGIKGNLDLTPLQGLDIPFLVTDDNGTGLTAVGKPSHPVTRLISLHNVRVSNKYKGDGYSITGELYPYSGTGQFDPSAPPNPVTTFAPFQVRLIQ